jgi:predicted GNAT family acetyltransferase
VNVAHDAGARRFVAAPPDGEGFLSYREIEPGLLDFEYVEVAPRFRGRGVAGQIVDAACRHARAEGARVVPTCPYIAWWFRQHPEHHDLLRPRDAP